VRALREMTQRLVGEAEETVPVLVRYDRKGEQRLTVVKVGREALPDEPYFSRKAWLPAATQVLTRDLAEALGVPGKPGVRITQIYPGHSAESAGMQVGDLLIGMDGEPIEAFQPEDVEVLPHMVRQYKIGSEATFQVLRNGEPMDITVELESPPTPASELRRYKDETFELTVRELSFRDRVSKRLEEQLEGVLIEAVENAGWAALARVAIGDILISIDGEPTTDPDTVERILNKAADEKRERLTFFVRRGIHTMYLEVELSWDNGNGHL
jgi:S1-C subfamily serine protease